MEHAILIHPDSGEEFSYNVDHAERILKANTGWKKKRGRKAKSGVNRSTDQTTTKGTNAKSSEDCGCGKS